jgi:hypothetical protein
MGIQVFVFLLVFFLILSLALLWHLSWLHHQPSHSQAGRRRTLVHRLLKPRTPLDCPLCRLCSSDVRPASAPVRPWCEVKSRRGAPKRIHTEGFACPNQQCSYFGITDAHIHALVGDGKHGRAEQIQTFRCQACRTTFTSRRNTPLYRLKTPSHQIAMVLSALAEGLDVSAAERVFGYRHATITTWLSRAGEHAQTLHKHYFCNLQLPHVQLDELRTRLRSCTQVLWLWLAIDPCTKLLPVLYLGPRTQNAAHTVIHSLRQILAAFLHPPFHQRWLKRVLLCADSAFWTLARSGASWTESPSMAGSGGADLRSSKEKLPKAEAGQSLACDASGDTGRSHSRLTRDGFFWTTEHRFY